MKQIIISDWILEVDVKATREYYQCHPKITDGCDCIYCKNFVAAVELMPQDVASFFESLGIDPTKEGEVSEYCENTDGTHLYGGFYHVVGNIINGPDCWVNTDSEVNHLSSNLLEISGFSFGFTYTISLLPADFPKPAIQLEFQGNVPWILEEKPDS
ncbi:hypothetical protein [Paenibacillus silviterrae]|uniref:hypothetical protein n=1 Tax=Paenibacillus silviterrae TaxID=3242194 RepID=UPI002543D08F|nr:hypothetical protein [Paenibacillus chinjuensis]